MAPKKKGKNDSSAKPPASSHSAVKQTPNWPAFAPLIPESDLSLQELLPGQIVTIPNFWTATLCKNYVSFLSSLSLTTTPGKPKRGEAVRVNDRFQIDDPVFAERLWSGTVLKNLVLGNVDYDGLGLDDAQRKQLWGGEVVMTPSRLPPMLPLTSPRLASTRTFASTAIRKASSLTSIVCAPFRNPVAC